MNQAARRGRLAIAFTASFLAVGIPYWLIPYGMLNLPEALLRPALATSAMLHSGERH
ncbi:MAG TPA: hypothetical protein VFL97_03845 [Nitrococcus sp.]|nr:hypothetical protein [Nitrococcus sp.]